MNKRVLKIFFLSNLILFFIFSPIIIVKAQKQAEKEAWKIDEQPIFFKPSVSIPGKDSEFIKDKEGGINVESDRTSVIEEDGTRIVTIHSSLLARYIQSIYKYAIGVGITLAMVMVAVGGVIWLTSAGSPDKIGQAKNYISGAMIGLVLLLGSYTILKSININLTKLNAIKVEVIAGTEYGCCQYTEEDGTTVASREIERDCKADSEGRKWEWSVNKQLSVNRDKCEPLGCCKRYSMDETRIEICTASTQSYCDSQDKKTLVNAEFEANSCDKIKECGEAIGDCIGIEDGERCKGEKGNSIDGKCWCYNDRTYMGLGKSGEPCGSSGTCSLPDNYWRLVTFVQGKILDGMTKGRACVGVLSCYSN